MLTFCQVDLSIKNESKITGLLSGLYMLKYSLQFFFSAGFNVLISIFCYRFCKDPLFYSVSVKQNLVPNTQSMTACLTADLSLELTNSDTRYNGVIVSAMALQITGVSIVFLTVGLVAYQRIHQNSSSLALARGLHRWPVNSPHKRRGICFHLMTSSWIWK